MTLQRCSPSPDLNLMKKLWLDQLSCTEGLTVTSSGWQTIQKAQGEGVILGCRYSPGPSDTGDLDIEWSVVSPDSTKKDRMLLSYTSGARHHHGDQAFAEELSFASGDPSSGDASLSIPRLSPAHSATYQCKVKKLPGVDSRKMSLVVMVKPSAPKCWLDGGELVGGAVSLHCTSAEGSTPLEYKWRRESKDPLPAAATQNGETGELKINNHSQSFAGVYVCEVNNAVGAEYCRIYLKAKKPPNRAGVIVGNTMGSLLLIFIFLVLAVLLYWKLRIKRRYEKELSNEIREDAPPPESRPASRRLHQNPQPKSRQTDVSEAKPSNVGRTRSPSSNSRGQTPVKYAAAEYESRYAV
ncbi:coxsackievirus and adenovirus receptor homolog [Nematolebias whitei]|uniref:coxsackievirus and adenovirus receptor homolog n=1 Tax=Nematolebias whitei TaxID=451745 RepID=UPI001899B8CD|nr:coxsackievirus and adenovirus receptor homolog [Nematolebias whitei]